MRSKGLDHSYTWYTGFGITPLLPATVPPIAICVHCADCVRRLWIQAKHLNVAAFVLELGILAICGYLVYFECVLAGPGVSQDNDANTDFARRTRDARALDPVEGRHMIAVFFGFTWRPFPPAFIKNGTYRYYCEYDKSSQERSGFSKCGDFCSLGLNVVRVIVVR